MINKMQNIELMIEERNGIKRCEEPVSVGVPYPAGLVFNADMVGLEDHSGNQVPVQKDIVAKWPDGSIKWLLLDFCADCDSFSSSRFIVVHSDSLAKYSTPADIRVERKEHFISINTGKAIFEVDNNIFIPFRRVIVDGNGIISSSTHDALLLDKSKHAWQPHIDEVSIERVGPVKCEIRLNGRFRDKEGKDFCLFIARLYFYKNKKYTRIDFTLRNQRAAKHPGGLWDLGDPGSIYFEDCRLSFALAKAKGSYLRWTAGHSEIASEFHAGKFCIYQDSSGGANWDSPSNINRYGEVKSSFSGYRVYSDDGSVVSEGHRVSPVVSVSAESGISITAIIKDFWQNFPKGIEVDNNKLSLCLFPGKFNDDYELQGGEQKTHIAVVYYDTLLTDCDDLYWVQFPLIPRCTPQYYSESMAMGYLSPEISNEYLDYQTIIEKAIVGDTSFYSLREEIDEYGWRNFGDVYANHERVGYKGNSPVFVSHYNNQYDVIYGCILQFARTGDLRWFDVMTDLARHVLDIDIYHTEKDRPAFNGGMFWHTDHFMHAETSTHRSYSKKNIDFSGIKSYGGGLSPEHCYTTGLCSFYYLTGDSLAKDAVVKVAEWIMNQDKIEKSILGILRKVKKVYNALTGKYHILPDRANGNALNALVDAYKLVYDRKYIARAEEIIKKCIAPTDDIDMLDKQKLELRWFYLIFLQSLCKYLDLKKELGDYDEMFNYARESLLHHATWMLYHERPYGEQFDRVEIASSTWPAHDVRKSAIFNYAAMYSDEDLKEAFIEKADYYFRRAITDIQSYKDGSSEFVRPIAILMNYGSTHLYFQYIRRFMKKEKKLPTIQT